MKKTNYLKCKDTRYCAQKERGITLIALVITIILLLILAGVTLKIVIDEGFVDKTQTAVDKYSQQQARENLEIALLNYKIGQLTGEEKTLQEYLEEANITVSNKEGENYTVQIKGYEFKINEKTFEIEESSKTEPSEPTKPEETKYTITAKHYLENANDENYTYQEGKDTTQSIAKDTTINLKDYKTEIADGTYKEGKIAGNGEITDKTIIKEDTTINLYYARNKYKLALEKGDYIETVTGVGEYKVGQNVTINATILPNTLLGYSDNKWVNWTSSNTSLIADSEIQNATITMPKGNVTLTANAAREIKTLKCVKTGPGDIDLRDIGTVKSQVAGSSFRYRIIFQSGGYTINVRNNGIPNAVSFTNLSGDVTKIVYQLGANEGTNLSPYNITEQGELVVNVNTGNINVELTVTSTGEKVPIEFEGYKIKMDDNGGRLNNSSVYRNYTVEKGKSIRINSGYYNYLVKNGYTLLGYSEDKNATTATYAKDATITPTKDMTLYAIWQAN